jgi:hypothetical protein
MIKDILSKLDLVTSKYEDGYGEKENNIHLFLKEENILHSFIKDQGFIIPSLNKPKKVVFVSMAHPDSFNYSFKSNLNYNLLKFQNESFIKGGLLNTLNVAIVLEFLRNNKEVLNDTIFVLTAYKKDSLLPINSFLKTINKNLRKELLYINIDFSQEKNISPDAIFRTKDSSFDLIKYITNKYEDYNIIIGQENRNNTFLDAIVLQKLIGFNLSLPLLNDINMFTAMTSLFSIERFYSVLSLFLLDSYDNLSLEQDLNNLSINDVIDIKDKKELSKIKNKNIDVEQFKDALYMTIADLNLRFDNEDFLIHYLTSKYSLQGDLKLNFLITKLGQKKDLKLLFNTLIDYGVLDNKDDNIYSFN